MNAANPCWSSRIDLKIREDWRRVVDKKSGIEKTITETS